MFQAQQLAAPAAPVCVQAQYRAAVALEALGRVDEAVQRAERAAEMQSSAEVSALVDRLCGLSVNGATRTRPGQSDRPSSTAAGSGGASRDDHFLRSAAPKLASARSAVVSHARCFLVTIQVAGLDPINAAASSPGSVHNRLSTPAGPTDINVCPAVVKSKVAGRSLAAKATLKAGSVVITEQPSISVLSEMLRDKVSVCMQNGSIWRLIPPAQRLQRANS